jgi:hypothetical protein
MATHGFAAVPAAIKAAAASWAVSARTCGSRGVASTSND